MEKTIRRKLEMIWEGVRSFTQRAIGSPIHIMWRWFGGTTHFRRRGGFKKIMMVPLQMNHPSNTINVELVIRAVPMMAAAVATHRCNKAGPPCNCK